VSTDTRTVCDFTFWLRPNINLSTKLWSQPKSEVVFGSAEVKLFKLSELCQTKWTKHVRLRLVSAAAQSELRAEPKVRAETKRKIRLYFLAYLRLNLVLGSVKGSATDSDKK